MPKWGKTDFRELKEFQQRLEKLAHGDFDRFFHEAAKDIAGRLLAKVKKRTPVIYGNLRSAWAVLPVEKRGNEYIVTVINGLQYASYVEYGHRQQPGRFIPGHWEGERFMYDPNAEGGMVLKDSWVEGRFMLRISAQEIERQAPALLERKLNQFLKGCLDA